MKERKTAMITTRCDFNMRELANRAAKREGRSLQKFMHRLLFEYLRHNHPELTEDYIAKGLIKNTAKKEK